jgi:hypothetical protein
MTPLNVFDTPFARLPPPARLPLLVAPVWIYPMAAAALMAYPLWAAWYGWER